MDTLSVDGGRIHAETVGDGEAVLLLHAGVADRRVWDLVVPALVSAGYRAVRYDSPGFGLSPAPAAAHSLVGDALAVLDAAGVSAAHFVGLSQGAATSIDVALAQPGRVSSLTLVAPGLTGYAWPPLPGSARRMAAAEAGDAHRLAMEIARLWAPLSFNGGECPTDDVARIIVDQAAQFMRDELEVEEPPAVDRLGEIARPTLVVLGDQDLDAVAAIGAHIAHGIPGARLVTLDKADHMLPLRVPDRLADLLREQLRSVRT
ncbi:alpha/beta hydrolase [Virgisporangium aliadipatigenens]|uniref:Alpha/beta hydrolase n=1 Tax=Virgisporangium aliadipatigenens TaxID=741659 RepID=A0A8J3YIV0_9ACTN|nr:alpha/beta fold hydrolase [Virgisporangium aliadipatigenens]GIJ44721.1 alpha/beta hydrolase [Virgisporangium aliadipatigenens]